MKQLQMKISIIVLICTLMQSMLMSLTLSTDNTTATSLLLENYFNRMHTIDISATHTRGGD